LIGSIGNDQNLAEQGVEVKPTSGTAVADQDLAPRSMVHEWMLSDAGPAKMVGNVTASCCIDADAVQDVASFPRFNDAAQKIGVKSRKKSVSNHIW
jgi:hypothetical protein